MFAPSKQDHLFKLGVFIETLPEAWDSLQKHLGKNENHTEFCYGFILDFAARKPQTLSGGPSTLISKVFEAIGTGGTNTEILVRGLMMAEEIVSGVASAFLAKLDEITENTDKAEIV